MAKAQVSMQQTSTIKKKKRASIQYHFKTISGEETTEADQTTITEGTEEVPTSLTLVML